ncbi:MAG: Endolytic murein transglycosylase [Chloroflexi bacterium]|nr:Endolytic murein transglycosylase [Chloroflexota bacterium]
MPKKRLARIKAILFLTLVALGVLAFCFLGEVVTSIPDRAEQLFGPPAPGLGTARLYYQSLTLTWQSEKLTTPANAQGGRVVFTILPGESPTKIIQGLKKADLITHAQVFRTYLIYKGLDTSIQAGEYTLSQSMSPVEIAQALQDATPTETTFTLLAGWRAEEIAQALPAAGLEAAPEAFMESVHDQAAEGFLFPQSYQLPRKASPAELVAAFRQEFDNQVTPSLREGFEAEGFSLQEAVTLASIVEREAVLDEEMPRLASVFINRLRADMTLSADPTVQYALGYDETQHTWWTNPLSLQDLEITSPYNTYNNQGLPPGPICNPSLEALQAVASPAQTTYYYFRAACDGSGRHLFSETYEEHVGKGCE